MSLARFRSDFIHSFARTGIFFVASISLLSFAPKANGAVIEGRVYENPSGATISSVYVRVIQTFPREVIADLDTNAEGRFTSPDLPPGNYHLEFSKPTYLPAELPVTIDADAQPIAIRMIKHAVISGRIVGPDGQPSALGIVAAHAAPQRAETAQMDFNEGLLKEAKRTAAIAADGTYRLHSLSPGRYILIATMRGLESQLYSNGSQPHIFEVTGGEDFPEINFSLQPSPTEEQGPNINVSGTLISEPGYQSRIYISGIRRPNGTPGGMQAMITPPADGKFTMSLLPPGTYLALATSTRVPGVDTDPNAPALIFARSEFTIDERGGPQQTIPPLVPVPAQSLILMLESAPGCAQETRALLNPLGLGGGGQEVAQLKAGEPVTLEGLGPLRYRLTVTDPGPGCWETTPEPIDLSAPHNDTLTVHFDPLGGIAGHVDTLGQDPADLQVIMLATGVRDTETHLLAAIPAADGSFLFNNLEPGAYRLGVERTAEPAVFVDANQMIQFEVGTGSALEVELFAPELPSSQETPPGAAQR